MKILTRLYGVRKNQHTQRGGPFGDSCHASHEAIEEDDDQVVAHIRADKIVVHFFTDKKFDTCQRGGERQVAGFQSHLESTLNYKVNIKKGHFQGSVPRGCGDGGARGAARGLGQGAARVGAA